MTTIHETYAAATPVPFEGTRSELRGGEYLGTYARPDLFGPGDIVTGIGDGSGLGDYFYDPELRIDGNSFVWALLPDSILGGGWRGIAP